MKAVIMAGGKGTRIAQINSEVPKPMIPILDKPILQYQIECLSKQKITDIYIVVGHLGQVIIDYFGDGSKYNVNIQYIVEKEPLGTAGALFLLKDKINEDFILLNGDIIFDIDINRFYSEHKKCGALATLFTHPNSHPYDSAVIVADNDNKVVNWMHKEDERCWYKNRVNAGIHMLSKDIFSLFTELSKKDLDRDILKPLISSGKLYVYDSPEYVKDMGTPDRYYSVIEDINNGKVQAKNLSNMQKAVFLDRDGVINVYKGFIRDIDSFELIPGVSEAIKKINNSGRLVIVVTNQPVIARGELTWEELDEIHNKMETLLGNEGAYIDDIFICPHHPDKGFENERVEYKIECECRKPKPGMLIKAAEKYNINLNESIMIGDDLRDIEAGKAAGCESILIGQKENAEYIDLKECIDNLNL